MDFAAIGAAIADRYTPANVVPPAGYPNIRSSSANPPNQLGPLPAVLVFADDGTLEPGNGTRLAGADWLVRFYYRQSLDLQRESAALLAWLGILIDQHKTGVHLGIPAVVARAVTTGWKVGSLPYDGLMYSGLELRVHVAASEPWSPTP